ncbi:hypothetical protein FRC05_002847 [Tulasnella sp. 425]|nr:hypothetical protein FRC05_002847 [Tulasnella sp. 425]
MINTSSTPELTQLSTPAIQAPSTIDDREEKTATPTLAEVPIQEDSTLPPKAPSRPDSVDIDLEKVPPNNKVIEDHAVDDAFPEGGRGWAVVFGSFLAEACTFGLVNSWGVFQAHYQEVILPDVNPSTMYTAWIGSVQYSLVFLPGLFAGRLFDIGFFHPMLMSASCLLVLVTFLVAECHQFWQFMLVQGIVTGVACGFIFGGALPVTSHWFKKKRSTAFGLSATGGSYGGTVFPIITRNLIPHVGFSWTMRILGLIILAHLALANLLVRRRLPPVKVAGGLFNLAAFKSAPYSFYVASATIAYLGIYACLTFIDVSAGNAGISSDFSFYLVAIGNAGSGCGRVLSGILSDKAGALNILIPFSVLAAAFTMIWPWCTTKGSLIAIALLYGISSGAFVGLLPVPVAQLGGTGDIGRRTGMLFTIASIGAVVGPPLNGAIYSTYNGFHQVGIFAGTHVWLSSHGKSTNNLSVT